jgi:hypothetical protein
MPKRVPALSAKTLAAIRPTAKPIELVDGYLAGLRVRIHPSGVRTWSLNVRDPKGKRVRVHIGTDLGLAEARRKAEDERRSIREGANSTAERRAARQRAGAARDGVGTLGALLKAYFLSGPGAEWRRAAKSLRLLQTVFSGLLDRPTLDVGRAELQRVVDGWRSPSSASLAVRRVLQQWCLEHA